MKGGAVSKSRKYVVKAGSYDGERKDNMRHGKGSYMWACGQKYDGEWCNDVRCGEGTETWMDGRKYHGEWKDDMFHGHGVFTWADGRVFKGTFKNYCPVEGLLYLPDGSMYEVKYAGDTPVFDGTWAVPSSRKKIQDQALVETHFEAMFSELSKSRVFSRMLREQFIKYDDVELSHSSGTLRIDEVIINSEDIRSSMEVRFSFDVRRMSTEASRHSMGRSSSLSKREQETAARLSQEISRMSIEMSRRVSSEMKRIAMQRPSVDRFGPEGRSLLGRNHSFIQEEENPMQIAPQIAPQPRAIAA